MVMVVDLLFKDEKIGSFYSEEPYKTVKIDSDNPEALQPLLTEEYVVENTEGEQELISAENPISFLVYLQRAITGSYWRATEARVEESDNEN